MLHDCVREVSTKDRKALKGFVVLERQLLGAYPHYVSNFDSDVIRQLSGVSAFTRDVEISLFIASDGTRDIARCAALVNPRYQQAKNEKVGFIGYFAAASGYEPYVLEMLERAEGRLKQQGVCRAIAAHNSNTMIGFGCLTAAFDEEPVMFAGWNPPYYHEYLTRSGYAPTYPLLVYTVDTNSQKYRTALERARASLAFHVRPIDKKKWASDLEIFRRIINDNFSAEWEWHPVTRAEFSELFDQLKPVIDPQQMLIAEVQGEPAGVCIGLPNRNPLFRTFKGKLGPLQVLQTLARGRRYENAGLVFAAVKPEFRGRHIAPTLEVLVTQRYKELGVKQVSGYTVNTDNVNSRKVIESIGGVGRVLYHAYDKALDL